MPVRALLVPGAARLLLLLVLTVTPALLASTGAPDPVLPVLPVLPVTTLLLLLLRLLRLRSALGVPSLLPARIRSSNEGRALRVGRIPRRIKTAVDCTALELKRPVQFSPVQSGVCCGGQVTRSVRRIAGHHWMEDCHLGIKCSVPGVHPCCDLRGLDSYGVQCSSSTMYSFCCVSNSSSSPIYTPVSLIQALYTSSTSEYIDPIYQYSSHTEHRHVADKATPPTFQQFLRP